MAIREFYEYIVLGAGLSGLSAGYQLHKQNEDFTILESDTRAGGVIKSEFIDGLLVEHGANSLVMTPAVEKLCEELGIIEEIVPALAESKIRQILWNNELHSLKASPLTLINTGLISAKAKLRILKEPFIKSISPDGESVLAFFTRRFGIEVAERMAGAIVSGIYAGDAAKLEIAAVFPRFVELERQYGSLLKGLKKSPPASRKIVSFNKGVETLTSSLSNRLKPNIHLDATVKSVKRFGHHWEVKLMDGTKIKAGKVISTLPYHRLKKVLKQDHFPDRKLTYNPMLTLQVRVDLKELQKKTKGFGFLASSFERKDFIGVMYNGNTFPTAIHNDKALINFFVRPDNCKDKKAKKVFEKLCEPLFRKWTGFQGDLELIHFKYWKKAIPQKSSGHTDWLKEIQIWETRCPNFKVLGNYINGVSLGDCIEQTMKDTSQF